MTSEIGEDLFIWQESQQTPSAVGLNVLLDDEQGQGAQVASLQSCLKLTGRNRTLWKHIQEMLPFPHFGI